MTYVAQCLNSCISVKIDYIPLLRTCGGWASQNNHSSVKKKEPRRRVYWQVQQIYEKYTSCFHTILVMLCHHCYHPSYEDTERQFFSIFYVVLCHVCVISVLLFSLQVSFGYLPLSKNTLGLLVILNWGMWLLFTPCQLCDRLVTCLGYMILPVIMIYVSS